MEVNLLDLASGKTIRFEKEKFESVALSSDGHFMAAISTADSHEHLITVWQQKPGRSGKYQFADAKGVLPATPGGKLERARSLRSSEPNAGGSSMSASDDLFSNVSAGDQSARVVQKFR